MSKRAKTAEYPKTMYVSRQSPDTDGSIYYASYPDASNHAETDDVVEVAEYQFVRMVKVVNTTRVEARS